MKHMYWNGYEAVDGTQEWEDWLQSEARARAIKVCSAKPAKTPTQEVMEGLAVLVKMYNVPAPANKWRIVPGPGNASYHLRMFFKILNRRYNPFLSKKRD